MPALTRVAPALLGGVLALAACGGGGEPGGLDFPVTFVARADDPLPGVTISLEGQGVLGQTDQAGQLRVTLSGREGTQVPFRVACPDGHRTPREMPALTLRRFTGLDPAAAARGIEVSIECPPAERLAALVVRAGRPGLPVIALGREVARTGDGGIAHALVRLPPNSTFRVVVDTEGEPRLRPRSPATTLTLGDGDEIFVIDQAFEVDAPAARPRKGRARPKRPVKTGPERLN